jgi:hypothetical protein
VRGDFVRDLYAKTLALVGLGVLAGTGALLDYWPAGMDVLVPSSPSIPVEQSVAPAIAENDRLTSAPVVRRIRVGSADLRSASDSQSDLFVPRTQYHLLGSHISFAPRVRTLDVSESPSRLADAVMEPSFALREPLQDEHTETGAMTVTQSASREQQDDEGGLVTVAFRKTGSSIAKTGARAGSSIVGAVRGISGAVRKALPAI